MNATTLVYIKITFKAQNSVFDNSKININRFEAFNTPSGFVWNIGMFSSVKGSDFSALLPQAETIDNSVSIALAAEGNEKIYNINQFDIVSEDKSCPENVAYFK